MLSKIINCLLFVYLDYAFKMGKDFNFVNGILNLSLLNFSVFHLSFMNVL